ncbi:MAG: TrmH family RNA methyltransferase [Pseudonocardia sp.]
MSPARPRSRAELRHQRRPRAHSCWDHLILAPLWPLHGANLGTLLRTCDAVGACLAVPRERWVADAVARGNTLRRRSCVHRVPDPVAWLAAHRAAGSRLLAVELADEAIRLADLPAAHTRTVVVLGHERDGVPPEALELCDAAVEIPMIGTGLSLNVAVAGSLVAYRLAGML